GRKRDCGSARRWRSKAGGQTAVATRRAAEEVRHRRRSAVIAGQGGQTPRGLDGFHQGVVVASRGGYVAPPHLRAGCDEIHLVVAGEVVLVPCDDEQRVLLRECGRTED